MATPIIFLDSGVVISMGLIRYNKMRNVPDAEIADILIQANKTNIGLPQAQALIRMYDLQQQGEAVFAICPMVYNETIEAKAMKKTITYQATKEFVDENCSIAIPNEQLSTFAYKTAFLANLFKNEVSNLNSAIKNRLTGTVDDDIEDRILLAQIIIMALQGKQSFEFITTKQMYSLNETTTESEFAYSTYKDLILRIKEESVSLHTDSELLELYGEDGFSLKTAIVKAQDERIMFVQHNTEDFGTKEGYNLEVSGHNTYEQKVETYQAIRSVVQQFAEENFTQDGAPFEMTDLQLNQLNRGVEEGARHLIEEVDDVEVIPEPEPVDDEIMYDENGEPIIPPDDNVEG